MVADSGAGGRALHLAAVSTFNAGFVAPASGSVCHSPNFGRGPVGRRPRRAYVAPLGEVDVRRLRSGCVEQYRSGVCRYGHRLDRVDQC